MKPEASAQQFQSPYVLIVFPSDEHRILLLQAVVQAGMVPLLCESADEALEAMNNENIQVVVCEDLLPEHALRRILKHARSRMNPIPVIVTSRTGEWDEFLIALRLGAFDYLVLPPRQDEVRRVLRLALAEGSSPKTEGAGCGDPLISGKNPLVCHLGLPLDRSFKQNRTSALATTDFAESNARNRVTGGVSMFSKCANPSCRVEFECGKGQFFRFRKAPGEDGRPANTHSIQHYWLCAECARIYCLEHQHDRVVLLRASYENNLQPQEPLVVGAA